MYIDIRSEIEALSEQRTALWLRLSQTGDKTIRVEIKAVEAEIERLWQKSRQERARIRFGDRTAIIARARAEERLERAA